MKICTNLSFQREREREIEPHNVRGQRSKNMRVLVVPSDGGTRLD